MKKSIAPESAAQLEEIYAVLNKVGKPVTSTYVASVLRFTSDEKNVALAGERLRFFSSLGFLVQLPPEPGTPYGAYLYAINPDKTGFLENAYTIRERLTHMLEDEIVDLLCRAGVAMLLDEIVLNMPMLPGDSRDYAERKPRRDRVERVCEDLVNRGVLRSGPAGFYVKGAK